MKTVKITDMDEGREIFKSFSKGVFNSRYGSISRITMTQPDAYGEHKGYYELEVKELEVMDILSIGNWYEFSDDGIKWELGILQNISTKTPLTYQSKDGNKSEWYTSIRKVVAKPQPTLTYTQVMADNGELPSVGMECLIKLYHQDDLNFQKGYINGYSQDGKWLIFTDYLGNIESHNISDGAYNFKPLTPPIELIDGKAYQINHKGLESLGFYYRGLFVNNGIEIKESDCTNIQPLTVEAE